MLIGCILTIFFLKPKIFTDAHLVDYESFYKGKGCHGDIQAKLQSVGECVLLQACSKIGRVGWGKPNPV